MCIVAYEPNLLRKVYHFVIKTKRNVNVSNTKHILDFTEKKINFWTLGLLIILIILILSDMDHQILVLLIQVGVI